MPSPSLSTFGAYLIELCIEKKTSINKLGQLVGIKSTSRMTYAIRIKGGIKPSAQLPFRVMVKMADALKLDAEQRAKFLILGLKARAETEAVRYIDHLENELLILRAKFGITDSVPQYLGSLTSKVPKSKKG